jgi:hypothetical protein
MFANPTDNLSTLFKSCAKKRIFRLSLSSGFYFSCAQRYPNYEQTIRSIYPISFSKNSVFAQDIQKQKTNRIRPGISNIFISVISPN